LTDSERRRRRIIRLIVSAAALVVFLVVYIDDWGRDFRSYEAAISTDSADPTLRPLSTTRSKEEMLEAVRWAARRIRNWEYTGDIDDGSSTMLTFVRTNRLLRLRDDIMVRVEDRGDRRVVTGASRSRLEIGDLGRNPRNLRRLLFELRSVLRGANP
jgi:uncharacterized protein (DUF1499 family)